MNDIQLDFPRAEHIQQLKKEKVVRYLGLYLDEKLTWKAYSNYVQGKMKKARYLIYHLRKNKNTY